MKKARAVTKLKWTVAFLLIFAAKPTLAQSDVFDQFFRYTEVEHKAFYEGMPDETIDPFSGNLHVVQTDVVLPGRAGLDLRIVRSYSSKIWGRTDDASLASLLADTDHSVLGYGWSFHMGRIKNPNASGQPSSPCSGDYPVVEMPDGSARVFYRVSASNANVYISRDYWRMETNCSFLVGAGSCVWSNTGIRYEFSNNFSSSYTVGALGNTLVWPVSAIIDQYGNRISVTYLQDRSGAISSITDTFGRTISFTYVSGGDGTRLNTMTVGGNVYQYTYTPYATLGGGTAVPRRFLTAVAPPTGPSFKYAYAITAQVAQNQYALSSIAYPHGGMVGYSYMSVNFFPGIGPGVPFAVVSSKTVTDRGGTGMGAWTYKYSAPSSGMNKTTITRPDGRGGTTQDTYTMFGFGAVKSGSVWEVGLTQQISVAGGMETQTFTWDGRTATPVANSLYSAPGYSVCAGSNPPVDNVAYAPALAQKDIQRDGATYSTVYSNWDAFGQPQNVNETGQLSRATTWKYFSQPFDSAGKTLNLIRDRPITQKVCVAAECFSNSWTYNGSGYARDSETRSGVTTAFLYNQDGTLARVTDAVGKTLALSGYDLGGGTPTTLNFGGVFTITRTTTWEGWIHTQSDGRNNTTQFDYDGIGRVVKITPPGPNDATSYAFDNTNGTSVIATRGTGLTSYTKTTSLDGFGRRTATSDTLGVQTSVKYNELGEVWFRSYSYDASVGEVGEKQDRDALGRETTLTKGCRGATTPASVCSPTNYVSTVANVYQQGNCVQITEQRIPDSLTTQRCYSSFGDPEERWLTTLIDLAGKSWAYGYTAFGHLKTVTAPIVAGNRTYEYEPRQYLVGEKVGELGTIQGDTVSIRYVRNAIGQVVTRTDARGVTWTYDNNDGLSRLKAITYGANSGDNVTEGYQPLTNNLAAISSANGGTLNYNVHDELDRLRSQQWAFRGITYTTGFQYDGTGCQYQVAYPTGSVITQQCDANRRITSIALNGSLIVGNVVYHPSGKPKSITFGNGVSTTIVYDDRARTQSVTSPGVIDLAYQYDGVDNVILFDNRSVPGSSRSMPSPGGYDNLNRLTEVQAPGLWGNAVYQYDDLGNRKQKTVGNPATPYNSSTTSYTYDPQTNRLVTAAGSDSFPPMTFTWDLAARLASSSDGATYTYTGVGWRAQKTDPNKTTIYHYDATGRLLSETLPNGTKLRDYIYLGDRLVAVDGCLSNDAPPCSDRNWIHTDAVGSVLALTDGNGNVMQRLDYEPWGESWGATVAGEDRQYNGRVLDRGTGFYDYGARMFWPIIGRFISSDISMGDTNDPQSLNVYAYVLNSPFTYTDPTGRDPVLGLQTRQPHNSPWVDEKGEYILLGKKEGAFGFSAPGYGLQHWWIKTPNVEAGMGSKNAEWGTESAFPPTPMTKITNHVDFAQRDEPGTLHYFTEVHGPNGFTARVEQELAIGRDLGPWGLDNNCQTFCEGVLERAGGNPSEIPTPATASNIFDKFLINLLNSMNFVYGAIHGNANVPLWPQLSVGPK